MFVILFMHQRHSSDLNWNQLLNMTFAEKLNIGKFSHQNEANNFEQMFMNEVIGMVDCYEEELADMMEFIYDRTAGNELLEKEFIQNRKETVRITGNIIKNIFRYKKAGKAMPTIHVFSALFAAVRWDKTQKFQDHDIHDFRHATGALPYCDYFFTEKRLSHLVTQKLLAFDKFYDCQVKSTIDDAILALKNINF
jgi:hypothetical protein